MKRPGRVAAEADEESRDMVGIEAAGTVETGFASTVGLVVSATWGVDGLDGGSLPCARIISSLCLINSVWRALSASDLGVLVPATLLTALETCGWSCAFADGGGGIPVAEVVSSFVFDAGGLDDPACAAGEGDRGN